MSRSRISQEARNMSRQREAPSREASGCTDRGHDRGRAGRSGSACRPRRQETPEIKIGAFMPISGISADVGAQIKAGTEVAVERVQGAGDQPRGQAHRVRVIWYDDEGKADVGLNAVTPRAHRGQDPRRRGCPLERRLPPGDGRVPEGSITRDHLLLGLAEDRRADRRPTRWATCYSSAPPPTTSCGSLVAAVAEHAKPRKVALLNENTDAGRDFSRISRECIQQNAKRRGVVARIFRRARREDLTPQLRRSSAWAPRSSSARSTWPGHSVRRLMCARTSLDHWVGTGPPT